MGSSSRSRHNQGAAAKVDLIGEQQLKHTKLLVYTNILNPSHPYMHMNMTITHTCTQYTHITRIPLLSSWVSWRLSSDRAFESGSEGVVSKGTPKKTTNYHDTRSASTLTVPIHVANVHAHSHKHKHYRNILASFPGSSRAFCCILYKKRGESLDDLITCAKMYYAWFG